MNVLIIVDVQNDFCPNGPLAVDNGENIIPTINQLSNSKYFDLIVATQDWHPKQHMSFASKYNTTAFEFNAEANQVVWPDHCIQNSKGAELHSLLDQAPIQFIVRKGMHSTVDSYSAFMDNDESSETGLFNLIPKNANVYISGIATDVCVLNTALDAKKKYKNVLVISDACAEVDPNNIEATNEKFKAVGIKLTPSSAILNMTVGN